MRNKILDLLQHEIENVFGIQKNEIRDFEELDGSNINYSFIIKNQKYVIHMLGDKSIVDWEQEKSAYESLKSLNITDELVSYNNGIKIVNFIDGDKLSYDESDMGISKNSLQNIEKMIH
jgi:predicted Ser/Thr protein kinase